MSELGQGRMVSIASRSKVASWPSLSRMTTTFLSWSTITPVKDSAVSHGDDRAGESFANLGAGVDDIQEHRVEVVAPVSCQVGADISALAEKQMAAGALLFKDLLARLGDSGAFTNDGGQPIDPGVQLGTRGGL